MTKVYKFLYTIIQITKISYYQASRATRQLKEIFRVIPPIKQKNSCDSGGEHKVERNSHGFPIDLKQY